MAFSGVNPSAVALIPPLVTNTTVLLSTLTEATIIRTLPDCTQDPLRNLTICNTSLCKMYLLHLVIKRIENSLEENSTFRACNISRQPIYTRREDPSFDFLPTCSESAGHTTIHSMINFYLYPYFDVLMADSFGTRRFMGSVRALVLTLPPTGTIAWQQTSPDLFLWLRRLTTT